MSSSYDPDICIKCNSPRLSGGPDCQICNEHTDVCMVCTASQHDCMKQCRHDYTRSHSCGVMVCSLCDNHKGLARCYCGWSLSGSDGRQELSDMGETIDGD
jgi:hypothetical protein